MVAVKTVVFVACEGRAGSRVAKNDTDHPDTLRLTIPFGERRQELVPTDKAPAKPLPRRPHFAMQILKKDLRRNNQKKTVMRRTAYDKLATSNEAATRAGANCFGAAAPASASALGNVGAALPHSDGALQSYFWDKVLRHTRF